MKQARFKKKMNTKNNPQTPQKQQQQLTCIKHTYYQSNSSTFFPQTDFDLLISQSHF